KRTPVVVVRVVECSAAPSKPAHTATANRTRSIPAPRALLMPAFIAPPEHLIGFLIRARCNIGPAIAIEIGDDYLIGVGPILFDHMYGPSPARVAGVVKPDYPSLRAPSGGYDFQPAITIQIARRRFEPFVKRIGHHVFFPL